MLLARQGVSLGSEQRKGVARECEPPPSVTKERYLRQHSAVAISPITSTRRRSGSSPAWKTAPNPNRAAGSSIYPVLQNMVLATRALGLGTS